jgi:CheY-like chemotaxis protein
VLIVDDDADTVDCLEEIIAAHGSRVLTASNGKEALEELARLDGPCLILLDLCMPVMDGFQFLRALERYRSPEAFAVVVMSACTSVTPIHASVVARLDRPFELEDLLWVLDHLDPGVRAGRLRDADARRIPERAD